MNETTQTIRLVVNVLLIKDEVWSAQCLEHDVCAQAKTIQQAVRELGRMLVAEAALQKSLKRTLDDIPPAPMMYWRMYEDGATLGSIPSPPLKVQDHTPPAFMLPRFNEMRVAA